MNAFSIKMFTKTLKKSLKIPADIIIKNRDIFLDVQTVKKITDHYDMDEFDYPNDIK